MATILLTEEETAVYLGRPLTSAEKDNFNAWMELAQERLLGVLCLTEFPELDATLKLLLAQMFGVVSLDLKALTDSGITSKKVEDFSITYESNPDSPEVVFEKTFAKEIAKYSNCGLNIKSGKVIYGDCVRCI